MSLEDRLRQSFAAAIDEVRGKLESELQTALTTAQEQAACERDAAVAEARSLAEADLSRAFAEEKATIVSGYESALREARDSAEAGLAAARQASEAALVAARADAERAQFEVSRLMQQADVQALAFRDADQARLQATEAFAGVTRRMLDGVKALDEGTSLSEVLDALTAAAATEAGRAAMLVVKGDRLIGWRTAGFGDLDARPRTLEVPTSEADALARAVATSRPVITGSGPASNAPAFAGRDAQSGIAVPLLVGGRAVAVLYADSTAPGLDAAPAHPAVEVLVRHAGRCLEALTVQRAAQARASVRVSTPA